MDNKLKLVPKAQSFISKSDSIFLYGIAIFLMIFHHCFCIPERLEYNYVPILGNYEFEARLAWIGRLCVAIYAFVTGYALALKSRGITEDNPLKRIKNNVGISIKQLSRFYLKFWFVFVIFVGIGTLFFNSQLSLKQVLWGMLYGKCDYNGEWWYVERYLKFLIVYPFIEILMFWLTGKKHRKISIILLLAIVIFLFVSKRFLGNNMGTIVKHIVYNLTNGYMCIFYIAFVIGKFSIFELLDSKIKFSNWVSLVGIIICIVIRWFVVKGPSDYEVDVYLIAPLVFFLVNIIHKSRNKVIGFVASKIKFIGKYSTFIWLTHTFWIYYYFQTIVLLPKYSILIYIWSIILSLLTAILLDKVYSFIKREIAKLRLIFKKKEKSI